MAPAYKIAVIQLYPEPLQVEANHQKACKFIREAAAKGCHLAVLPEYHLTSWVPDEPSFSSLCSSWKKYLDSYCSLAAKLKICIVPGTIVENHSDKLGELLNVAYFISPEGTILGSYQKKNLWHPERPHLTSSAHTPHEAFDTPLGKAGMLICWDLAFPEAFRELVAHGAKLIVIPSFWTLDDVTPAGKKVNPRSEALFLESTIVTRTFENTCAVVFCNAGGPPKGAPKKKGDLELDWAGLSQVAIPFGGGMGKLGSEEGMSVVEIDMEILEEAERNYKVREDMGTPGWHYQFTIRPDGKKESVA